MRDEAYGAGPRRARARYALTVRTSLPPAEALARVLAPSRHAAVVPLTTLYARDGDGTLALGGRFTMRTALGPLRVDDEMRIDRLRVDADGGAVRFVKTGRVLRGVVLVRVAPGPLPQGAELRWDAELSVRHLPRALDPLVAVLARLGYGAALRQLLNGRAA